MFKRIKLYLKHNLPRLVMLYKKLIHYKYDLKDILDSYFLKSSKLTETPYGFKLMGSSSNHHLAMQRGEFETEEVALFNKLFNQAEVFIDVGANIGFYACMARQLKLHTIAVEPLEKNVNYLKKNIIANGWTDLEIFPLGLSKSAGIAKLYGASMTGASLISQWAQAFNVFQRLIPLSTLDIIVDSRFLDKKIFIKIDVEGAEYQVLEGAKGLLQRKPKPIWVVEITFNEYHPSGLNPHFLDIFDLFWQNGYEARTADINNKLIRPLDVEGWVRSGKCDSGTINYKFISS
jgi:FkbM family methyltransferase